MRDHIHGNDFALTKMELDMIGYLVGKFPSLTSIPGTSAEISMTFWIGPPPIVFTYRLDI